MGNKIKIFLAIVLLLVLGFLAYSITPRVSTAKTSDGEELKRSDILDSSFEEEITNFILDSASRMQNVMVAHQGEIIYELGDIDKLINCHSARKSVMSLLFGIAVDQGLLALDESLGELGIDESKTPLTKLEKSATVRDLLMCTSGIFLKAEAEHDWAGDIRPKRGEYKPGEFFFYNNFDFNVLGAILELKAGMSIGAFMDKYLAKPLAMQDFSPQNIVFNSPWPVPNKTISDFPVYWMYLSTRDFIKIGILLSQDGKWNNKQIISTSWLKESLFPYSGLDGYNGLYNPYDAFSYSWWIDNDTHTIWADGYGGQFLCIDSVNKLITVQRNFTGNSLLSSGIFLINMNRDNNPKEDLLHIYNRIKKYLGQA